MDSSFNPSVSVDCVIFGFDGSALKILLVEHDTETEDDTAPNHKLPGSPVAEEDYQVEPPCVITVNGVNSDRTMSVGTNKPNLRPNYENAGNGSVHVEVAIV